MIDDSINHEYIIRYLRDNFHEPSELISDMRRFAIENEVPIAAPETAAFLRFLCSVHKPSRILEIGTAIGYSSILMADVCDAEIITLERNEEMIRIARNNISRAGFENRITIIEGDAEETIKSIDEYFDLVFIDASKGHYSEFFNHAKINDNGIYICDNVLYKGMTATDELVQRRKITIIKRLRKFISDICSDDTYNAALLPLGDGILLAHKKH